MTNAETNEYLGKTGFVVVARRYETDDGPVDPISPKAVQLCFPQELRLSATNEDEALDEARNLTQQCREKANYIIAAAVKMIVDENNPANRALQVINLLLMKEILDFAPDYEKCLYRAQLDEDGQPTGVYWNVRDDSDDVD